MSVAQSAEIRCPRCTWVALVRPGEAVRITFYEDGGCGYHHVVRTAGQ